MVIVKTPNAVIAGAMPSIRKQNMPKDARLAMIINLIISIALKTYVTIHPE